MKVCPSGFYDTSIRLSFFDLVALLFGGVAKGSGYVVGLWKAPDNGCPCSHCRAVFGPIKGR